MYDGVLILLIFLFAVASICGVQRSVSSYIDSSGLGVGSMWYVCRVHACMSEFMINVSVWKQYINNYM